MDREDLRAWRLARGLSQYRLAILLGVTPGAIARWEQGNRPLPGWLENALAGVDEQLKRE